MAKWLINPHHTVAEFSARHMMVTNVRGHFKNVHGKLDFDENDPRAASVEVTIDARGLWTGAEERDAFRQFGFVLYSRDHDSNPRIKSINFFTAAARELKPGAGLDENATLCPVLSLEQRQRILDAIERGVREGARLVLDGRGVSVSALPGGCFVGATVFDDVKPEMFVAREEIFGPVVSVLRARDLGEAIELANRSRYGNSVSLFTRSGSAAREFRARIQAGMLGVNLGVPAPMAFFSFGGWKESFFGDLNAHGPDAVAFYTRKKVVTERWFGAEAPREGWS